MRLQQSSTPCCHRARGTLGTPCTSAVLNNIHLGSSWVCPLLATAGLGPAYCDACMPYVLYYCCTARALTEPCAQWRCSSRFRLCHIPPQHLRWSFLLGPSYCEVPVAVTSNRLAGCMLAQSYFFTAERTKEVVAGPCFRFPLHLGCCGSALRRVLFRRFSSRLLRFDCDSSVSTKI